MVEKEDYTQENMWKNQCHELYGKILSGKFQHYCPDNKFLPTDETVPAFKDCKCSFEDWRE